jgi:N-methylhydantoinase A
MSVPLPEAEHLSDATLIDLAARFHRQHETTRGFSFPSQQPLVRGIRLIERGLTTKPPVLAHLGTETSAAAARTGQRPAHFGEGFVDTPTYDGARLGAGAVIEGPALIQEPFTVVVLAPGDSATLDAHGNYLVTVGS